MPVDYAGNTLEAARSLTLTPTTQTFTDYVNRFDTNDYYKFTLSGRSSFNLSLDGLTGNANVELLNNSNQVLQSSAKWGKAAESISVSLDSGTYYIRVYPGNNWARSNYTLDVSATPQISKYNFTYYYNGSNGSADYYTGTVYARTGTYTTGNYYDYNSIINQVGANGKYYISAATTAGTTADGKLDRNDMIALFKNVEDGNVIDATELTDLRTLVSNATYLKMSDDVRVLSNKIANGNTANANYQGTSLGNLYAGSSATQMEKLIGKWFMGSDRPSTTVGSGSTALSLTYGLASGSLFGNDGKFSYQDISQGSLGDCYFLAALGATTLQRPSAIQNMFIDNGDGTYTVRLFGQNGGTANGTADYVTVDKYLATNVSSNQASGQIFANYDNANVGLWVALAEKAYAQFAEAGVTQRDSTANNYGSIEGGWGFRTMPSLSGINAGYYADTSYSNLGSSLGSFLSLSDMAKKLASGFAMTADTIFKPSSTSPDINPLTGIVYSHEYIVVSADTTTGKVTLYNPWGDSGQETGDNRGIKVISYNDFKTNFNMINLA